MDACREFRTHTQGRDLNRFNTKNEEIMVNLPDDGNLENLTSTHFKVISSFVINGFGCVNRLKCIKRHMMSISKPHASPQDAF